MKWAWSTFRKPEMRTYVTEKRKELTKSQNIAKPTLIWCKIYNQKNVRAVDFFAFMFFHFVIENLFCVYQGAHFTQQLFQEKIKIESCCKRGHARFISPKKASWYRWMFCIFSIIACRSSSDIPSKGFLFSPATGGSFGVSSSSSLSAVSSVNTNDRASANMHMKKEIQRDILWVSLTSYTIECGLTAWKTFCAFSTMTLIFFATCLTTKRERKRPIGKTKLFYFETFRSVFLCEWICNPQQCMYLDALTC